MRTNPRVEKKGLPAEQVDRLWQRYLSEEEIFNNRLNLFLVLESLLVGAVITIIGQTSLGPHRSLVLRVSMFLGLGLTIVWIYVSARQKWVLGIVRQMARDHCPEFSRAESLLESGRWPVKIRSLLAHVVPTIFLLVWIILQFAV